MDRSSLVKGVALMAVAMSLIPTGDAAGKLMATSHGVSPFFIAWARFIVGAVVLFPFLAPRHRQVAVLLDWRIILRGLFIVCGISAILTALQTEDLATVFGAFFIGPILSFFLSALLLGERITPARTCFLLVGFLGVMLVVKPGFGMTPGLGFAVLAGVFYSLYLVASRWLSDVAPPRGLLFAQLLTGAVVLAPLGLMAVPSISGELAILLAISGVSSMLGNLLLILAYRQSEAARLAPFVYFQLVAATVLGYAVFGDWPDQLAFVGLFVLLASGFATFALGENR